MSVLQVTISDDDARLLAEKAGRAGISVDALVNDAIRQLVRPMTWAEIAAPLQEAMAGHGMSDEELVAFFEAERQAMRAEQRSRP